MKLSDSQYPLKKVLYRMFSLLVVVPLIVVFAAAAVILYQVMRTSAVDTISAFQETVATTLNTDIKSASLQLSHFVYVNDGEFLDVANRVYSSSGICFLNANIPSLPSPTKSSGVSGIGCFSLKNSVI